MPGRSKVFGCPRCGSTEGFTEADVVLASASVLSFDETGEPVFGGESDVDWDFRVPMIIASPWSRGGWVNSQLFDHTSTLMFLEQFIQNKYGKTVREENISAWRRAVSGDLTSVFRPHDAKESALDFVDRDKFVVSIEQARYKEIPSNYKKLSAAQIEEIHRSPTLSPLIPHQEPGIRPACALPYELYADGVLSVDGSSFDLQMTAGNMVHGKNAVGAPFNVYLRNIKGGASVDGRMRVATYAVKPGDTLRQQFPLSLFEDSKYSIEVHGPNGFYRSFIGDPSAGHVQVHAVYEQRRGKLTGNVRVHLRNPGSEPLTAAVQDNSYKTGTITKTVLPGHEASVVLQLGKTHGWYDFSVKANGSEIEARFAGRVETSRTSISDPLMGGAV